MTVRKDVQAKTEQMEKSVRVGEREYSKKMAELNRGFDRGPHARGTGISREEGRNALFAQHGRRARALVG